MIYLTRHGQTSFNAAMRLQGQLDSPLTDLGIAQARAQGRLLRRLMPVPFPIVSSPLGRAMATARIIADELGVTQIAIDDRLQEISFGDWDGLTGAEIDTRWPGLRHPSARISWANGFPSFEPYEAVLDRVRSWLEDYDGKAVIAVSHGVTGSVIRGLYAGLLKAEMLDLPIPQDAVFALSDGSVERIDCDPA